MRTWSTIVAGAGHLPAGVWMTLAMVNLVATVLTWSGAPRRMRRAGERAADPRLVVGGALPPGYLDRPVDGQVNGHDMAGAAA